MNEKVPWLKPALWGAVGGAVVMMIVGFSWLGWVLGATAERMASERSTTAVVAAMTPSCVTRFMAQPKAAVKLAELRKTDSWQQREVIEKGGWATIGSETTPNSALAAACSDELLKTKM
jgi:hypothetical protein